MNRVRLWGCAFLLSLMARGVQGAEPPMDIAQQRVRFVLAAGANDGGFFDAAHLTASRMMAMPWPPPIHCVARA